jgi:hypothetical protein
MDLRPYGIGESGGYLAVADDPRPPAGAKQSAPQSLARSRLALPWGTPERSTALDRPRVPVRRLIPVGSLLCPSRLGSRLVSDLNAPLATSGQDNPMGSIHLKDWLGNDQFIGLTKHDAEREANR